MKVRVRQYYISQADRLIGKGEIADLADDLAVRLLASGQVEKVEVAAKMGRPDKRLKATADADSLPEADPDTVVIPAEK